MMTLKYSIIKKLALIYIALPLLCFFIGWLKWYFALVACFAVFFCLFQVLLKSYKENKEECVQVSLFFLFVLVMVSIAFCFYCGIGRFWAQSKDYPWRNAIFRDIILRDWPVIYNKYDGALSYYIGIWLPPSLLGKISYFFSKDPEIAFRFGNIGLLIYSSIGIILLFLLIILYINPKKKIKLYLAILMFIFFSGMDILGSIEPLGANNYHLEWWAKYFQYSSFTTCMCWVFNQSIIPWICMLLVLKEKKVSSYVFIGMCCLLSGPLPFIGLFVYCIGIGIYRFVISIREKKLKKYIFEVFSASNILSSFFIFPFVGTYLVSNASFQGGGGMSLSNEVVNTVESVANANVNYSFDIFTKYLSFVLLEFLIYMLLIYRKNRKNYLFYLTLVMLLTFPFIRIGFSVDFAMRASIPSILFLYLMCVKFVFEESNLLKKVDTEQKIKNNNLICVLKRYSYVLLVVCLLLGAFTPSVEFIRGFRQVKLRGTYDIMTDYLYTLGEDHTSPFYDENNGVAFCNFVSLNYKDSFFFKHFADAD